LQTLQTLSVPDQFPGRLPGKKHPLMISRTAGHDVVGLIISLGILLAKIAKLHGCD
jgi:hypothetical protein